jgi:hypothetical protein
MHRALKQREILRPIGPGHAEGSTNYMRQLNAASRERGPHRTLDLRQRARGPSAIDITAPATARANNRAITARYQRNVFGIASI